MNPEDILASFKKGENDSEITEKNLTIAESIEPFTKKGINPEIQKDFEKYLELSKSDKQEDVIQALDWMDSYLILKEIIDFLPLDFLPALLSFYASEFGESAYDLLTEAVQNERYAEVLVQNGLIDVIKEMFPKNNSIIVCAFLCDHQEGRRVLVESEFLPVLNDFFREDLLPEFVEQIAFFIAHLTKKQFTFDDSIPIINEILLKFMPHVASGELSLLPSLTRAFDNALNSNSAFVDFFMANDLINPFLVFTGSIENFKDRYDKDDPKYHEENLERYMVETTTDTLDMFNAIVAENDDYTDQLIVHELLAYLDTVFYFADDRVRIAHTILLSSLLESRPELIAMYTKFTPDGSDVELGFGFHQMISDLAANPEIPARLVVECTMLDVRMIIAAEDNPEILGLMFEAQAFNRIQENCEMLVQIEEQYAAIKAITAITKLPRCEEIDHFLKNLAESKEFNEWLDDILQSDEITHETESYIHFLKDVLHDFLDDEDESD